MSFETQKFLRLSGLACPFNDALPPGVARDERGVALIHARSAALVDAEAGLSAEGVVMLADQALSAAVRNAVGDAPMATVSYRCDFHDAPDGGGDLAFALRQVRHAGPFAVADVDVLTADSEVLVASVRGRFRVGSLPGGVRATEPGAWPSLQAKAWDSLHAFLDIDPAANRFVLHPHLRLIGAYALPAFHGGVVAAALGLSARLALKQAHPASWRLTECEASYLRPSIAQEGTEFGVRIAAAGRTTAVVFSDAVQEGTLRVACRSVFERL